MARSLAFWFEEENSQCEAELHFNYWVLKSNDIKYLDIGVKFKTKAESEFGSINFYLPFEMSAINYVGGLGKTVCDSEDLLTGVFNSKVKNRNVFSNIGAYKMALGDEELLFFTHLDKHLDDSPGGVFLREENAVEGHDKGFVLSFPADLFKLDQDKSDTYKYFRFRIEIKPTEQQNSISRMADSKGAFLIGHLESTELVDFRVNEVRNLPSKIKAKLADVSPINKVHFFLIRDAKSEYKIAHQDFDRCRILENDLWQTYLKSDPVKQIDLPEQMLIYHWKEKAKLDKTIDHFSAFAKFTQWNDSKWAVFKVICWIVAFGALGSFLSSIVWSF